jgi:hypothetical protein
MTERASLIQRKMAFTSNDLHGSLTLKAQLSGLFGTPSTFAQIQTLLKQYESEPNPFKAQALLTALKKLGFEWLTKHATTQDKDELRKKASIEEMIAEIDIELAKPNLDLETNLKKAPTPTEQSQYMANILGGKYKYLTYGGAEAAKSIPVNVPKEATTLGLTKPELAAIRIYTAQDYKYMNPVLAQSEGWLDSKTADLTSKNEWKIKDTKLNPAAKQELKAEAFDHSRMAVSGLAKIPDWSGNGYRGLALPQADVFNQYADGKTVAFPAFSSTSTNETVSTLFALKEAMKSGGAKVPVLLVLQITKGKDIAKISAVESEAEVLLPPNSKFSVSGNPTKVSKGPFEVYKVTLVQTA